MRVWLFVAVLLLVLLAARFFLARQMPECSKICESEAVLGTCEENQIKGRECRAPLPFEDREAVYCCPLGG